MSLVTHLEDGMWAGPGSGLSPEEIAAADELYLSGMRELFGALLPHLFGQETMIQDDGKVVDKTNGSE